MAHECASHFGALVACFIACVAYGDEAQLFHGQVMNLRDVIAFQGRSVTELKKALRGSVADYVAFCAARGEEPEETVFRQGAPKACSGDSPSGHGCRRPTATQSERLGE